MTDSKAPFFSTLAVLAMAFPLAAIMVMRKQDDGLIFVLGALFLPVAWAIVETVKFGGKGSTHNHEDRVTLRQSVRSAGVLVLIPMTLTVVFTSGLTWINDEMEVRIMGTAFGVAMMIIANAIPKRPASMRDGATNASQRQAFARFAGLVLMVTGALYAIASFVTPSDHAALVMVLITVGGSSVVILRCIAMAMSPKVNA